jgi:N-ethylmaleimide reductase
LQPDGGEPVAPSAIAADGHAYTEDGAVEFTRPRALGLGEIPQIIEDFRRAAYRAQQAGFDGVEIHGANGYLPDQFLQDGSNSRTDEYGGSIANRARFLLEVTDAAVSVFGRSRVGVRIAPSGSYGSMRDSNPGAAFGYVADQLSQMGIGYLHVIEPRIKGNELIQEGQMPVAAAQLRDRFDGPIISAGGFTQESAESIVQAGHADLVAFGLFFISNPDLPERFRSGVSLTPYDRDSFYGGDHRGYTDYASATEAA